MGNNSKIALARFRIANLEQIIEDIQARHQADKENVLFLNLTMSTQKDATTAAPSRLKAAIKKLVADSVTAALEAQAATMTNAEKLL
ncbi:hypothetical protein Tco_0488606 [Tanacetum coccineum]